MLNGVFGPLPFITAASFVLTFSGFTPAGGERWAKHEVIGGKPVLELVGSEAASVDLDIRLDSSLGVPPMLGMKLLKTMLAGHDPHPLVTGTDYFGKFVLESFGERWKHLTGIGVCIVDEVSLKLTEYSKGWA